MIWVFFQGFCELANAKWEIQLEQIGVGTGAGKRYFSRGKAVYQQPIVFHMAFCVTTVVTGKVMLFVLDGQGFSPDNFYQNLKEIVQIPAAFLHELRQLRWRRLLRTGW